MSKYFLFFSVTLCGIFNFNFWLLIASPQKCNWLIIFIPLTSCTFSKLTDILNRLWWIHIFFCHFLFVSCERINLVPATAFGHSRSLEDLLVNSVCAKESEGVWGCCSKAEHGVSKTGTRRKQWVSSARLWLMNGGGVGCFLEPFAPASEWEAWAPGVGAPPANMCVHHQRTSHQSMGHTCERLSVAAKICQISSQAWKMLVVDHYIHFLMLLNNLAQLQQFKTTPICYLTALKVRSPGALNPRGQLTQAFPEALGEGPMDGFIKLLAECNSLWG